MSNIDVRQSLCNILGCKFSGTFLNSGHFTENVLISGIFVLYKRTESIFSKEIFTFITSSLNIHLQQE